MVKTPPIRVRQLKPSDWGGGTGHVALGIRWALAGATRHCPGGWPEAELHRPVGRDHCRGEGAGVVSIRVKLNWAVTGGDAVGDLGQTPPIRVRHMEPGDWGGGTDDLSWGLVSGNVVPRSRAASSKATPPCRWCG